MIALTIPGEIVYTVTIDGEPIAWQRPADNAGGRGRHTTEQDQVNRQVIGWAMRQARVRKPLEGEIVAIVEFHFAGAPRKIDADNLIKAVFDGGNGIAWVDDSQISDVVILRRFGKPKPQTILRFGPSVEPEPPLAVVR